MRPSFPIGLLVAPLLVILGCSALTPVPSPPPQARQNPDLELRSVLLLLVDRKSLEPFAINQALAGDEAMRERLALALASIGDRRSRPVLQALVADSSSAVRRAAAFGLGELNDTDAMTALLEVVGDPDILVGRAAIGALGDLGSPLAPIVERLIELEGDGLILRLVPELHRFPGSPRSGWAEIGLEIPELKLEAALVVLADAGANGREVLLPLLEDEDGEVRVVASRVVGERGDLELLKGLLEESSPRGTVAALRAVERLITSGQIAPPEDWLVALRSMLHESRATVRATAHAVAGAWLLNDDLGLDLLRVAEDETESTYLRELALSSLLRGGDDRASVVIEAWVSSPKPELRSAIARLVDPEMAPGILAELSADSSAAVRLSAIERRLSSSADISPWLRSALTDSDSRVRSAVLQWAVEHPLVEPRELLEVMSGEDREETVMLVIRALGARARKESLERGEIVVVLEHLARHPSLLVRREAGRALVSLGRPAPSVGSSQATGRTAATYKEIVLQTERRRRLRVRTERGPFEIELWCPRVPLTCLNFLQLARQGFYDGRSIDGGEPTEFVSIGAGGVGFSIRDEKLPETVDRGTLAMIREDDDTAGTEFLIASSRLPHLDRVALPFGRVLMGQEIVDDLIPGERILAIDEID